MKFRTIRYVAGAAIVPLAFEVLPRGIEPEDCAANVTTNLCSANDDPWAIEPWNVHTPHQEFDTHVGGGYQFQFLGSGVSSITTSSGLAAHCVAAGESVARRFLK